MSRLPKEVRDDPERFAGFVLGTVGCTAIVLALGLKGVNGENILDAIKDIAGLGTILFVAVIAIRVRKSSISLKDIGEQALEKLRKENEGLLSGPEFSSLAPDSDKSVRMKYLFFKRTKESTWKKKVAFVPLDLLSDGILDIRVMKSTLANRGVKSPPDEEIKRWQSGVRDRVKQVLTRLRSDQYKIMHPSEEDAADEDEDNESKLTSKASPKVPNSAITIAFDKDMKHRDFAKVVYDCAKEAMNAVFSFKVD